MAKVKKAREVSSWAKEVSSWVREEGMGRVGEGVSWRGALL